MRSKYTALNLNKPPPVELEMRQHMPRKCKLNVSFRDIEETEEWETKKPRNKKKARCDIDENVVMEAKEDGNKKSKDTASSSKTTEVNNVQNSEVAVAQQQGNIQLRKTFSIFAWLIDMKIVVDGNTSVCYPSTGTKYGRITRNGILCHCCSGLFSALEFQSHCGAFSADKPFKNIVILQPEVSLLAGLIEAWNRHSVPAKNGYTHVSKNARYKDCNDDSCMICADGGQLICCEKCPSTYHEKCLGFENVPSGAWHCPYCDCKYCNEDDSKELLLTCTQCLKKFHWKCSHLSKEAPFFHRSFCGFECFQVNDKLESMVGRSMYEPGFSWTLVRRMNLDAAEQYPDGDLEKRAYCNSMVAVAAAVMEDSFKIIVDRQSRANTVQGVVYNCGSNFIRTNFSRFYTAVLESHGEVITVATIRIPSPDIAEIPFIATAERHRNNGYCRRLLQALESVFVEMGVRHVLIPSAADMVTNWQSKFGFHPIDDAMKMRLKNLNTLMFPGTTRLQKNLKEPMVHDLNLSPAAPRRSF